MDITRNWRLKTSRSQLLATRCPATGAVVLPQSASFNHVAEVYTFDHGQPVFNAQADEPQAKN